MTREHMNSDVACPALTVDALNLENTRIIDLIWKDDFARLNYTKGTTDHCNTWCAGHTTGWHTEDPKNPDAGTKCSWTACSPCDACRVPPQALPTAAVQPL